MMKKMTMMTTEPASALDWDSEKGVPVCCTAEESAVGELQFRHREEESPYE